MTTTFHFAGQAIINSGIIGSLFSASMLFAFFVFYLKYGNKLKKIDGLGAIMMIGCVLMVSLEGFIKMKNQNKKIMKLKNKKL